MSLQNAFGNLALDASVQAIVSKLPTPIIEMPDSDILAVPVRQAPQKYTDCSYSQVGSGLIAPELVQIGSTGAGMAINQTAGNLVITTGTTVNAEIVLRSVDTFSGALTLKEATTLSQRIANNNFYIELVDIIGDGLAYSIVNTTTVDVTKPAHGYTAQNVGQRIDLCALSSVGVPMEGVIASIPDANTIRFTVAGWPASGSGTLSLTGWNKIELLYSGTTATNMTFNTRRKGWQNTAVTATINTTASGHIASMNADNGVASLADKTLAANNTLTSRTAWDTNIPHPDEPLYLQIRAKNGTTAPASTTTWRQGMWRVEDFIATQVDIVGTRQQSLNNSLPVFIQGTAGALLVSGTITASGTVGAAAHDAAISGNPLRISGRALTSDYAAVATGDVADLKTTLTGALITRPYAIPELEWSYVAASGGITNTTGVTIKAAAAAGIRNYLTGLQLANNSATATDVQIRDGAAGTVLWRGFLPANSPLVNIQFQSPIKGTAATLLEVACGTTGTATYVNAQGYTAP